MDTSETYIKMSDCEEIQTSRRATSVWDCGEGWEEGDFYYLDDEIGVLSYCGHCGLWGLWNSKRVWLPRQDQLQEMVTCIRDKKSGRRLRLITAFYEWLKEGETVEGDDLCFAVRKLDYNSMEQLWLAFVMKEKYNKVWNGENWVEMP